MNSFNDIKPDLIYLYDHLKIEMADENTPQNLLVEETEMPLPFISSNSPRLLPPRPLMPLPPLLPQPPQPLVPPCSLVPTPPLVPQPPLVPPTLLLP